MRLWGTGRFSRAQRQWIEQALEGVPAAREDRWSEAIAVGGLAFIEKVKDELGVKALHREVRQEDGLYALREPAGAYASKFADENKALRTRNTILWDETVDDART